MNISILQREFDELQDNPALFDPHNFRVRKEALDLVEIITKFRSEDNQDLINLQAQAQGLGEELQAFNRVLGEDFLERLNGNWTAPEGFRAWLDPYTEYVQNAWGKPHHGYESLDFLLDEVLLPQPHPLASQPREYGMVRYEPTPASVILELTERISFSDDDLFCDLGSGLGKVTMLVHLLTEVRCVGVEYQPDFCTYARQQADRLNLRDLSYLNTDARHASLSDATIFFFFNPFGGVIFDTVLEGLRLEAQQREIRICSYGSSSQPLSELPWLEHIPPVSEEEMALAIFRGGP
jgi:hypothetical protein